VATSARGILDQESGTIITRFRALARHVIGRDPETGSGSVATRPFAFFRASQTNLKAKPMKETSEHCARAALRLFISDQCL